MPIQIIGGRVVWPQNSLNLADSVIQREATFSPDRALANIYSSEGIRDRVLAYLSYFPLQFEKAQEDGRGIGPTLEILCFGHNVDCDGHMIWLRSDMPIVVSIQPDKEELISFVQCAPDRLILRRGSVYLNIKLVPPQPNCTNCELE